MCRYAVKIVCFCLVLLVVQPLFLLWVNVWFDTPGELSHHTHKVWVSLWKTKSPWWSCRSSQSMFMYLVPHITLVGQGVEMNTWKMLLKAVSELLFCPSSFRQGRIRDIKLSSVRPDRSSVHLLLCSRCLKNRWTFRFHMTQIYSSWDYLNLIRSRRWMVELCCHGNHLGNLARVHDIWNSVQYFAFIAHRSIPVPPNRRGTESISSLLRFLVRQVTCSHWKVTFCDGSHLSGKHEI